MKKLLAISVALCVFLTGCAGVTLNFSGVSPFRNIRDTELISALSQSIADKTALLGMNDYSVGVISGKHVKFFSSGDMDEHAQVNIGEMSQMFVGMLVGDFESRRWLGHDETVSDWFWKGVNIPGYEGEQFKVWQLACNVAGLGDMDTRGKAYATAGMLYNQLDEAALSFAPGEGYYQSELGYALLCELLRQSYNINANMVNLIGNQTYFKMDLQNSHMERKDALAGYNGFVSTSYDLMKVVGQCTGALLQDEWLGKAIAVSMTEVCTTEGAPQSMSFYVTELNGNKVYYRAGQSEDGASAIAFCPALGTGVTVTSREKAADVAALAVELLAEVY